MQNEEPKLCISFDLSHRQSLSLCISSCPSFYCCLYLSASLPLCGFAYIFLSVWVPPLISHFIRLFFTISHLLCVCLLRYVCISLSVSLAVFICLSDFICLSVCQSACLSLAYLSICMSLSVCLTVCLSLSINLPVFTWLSVCLYLFVCYSACLSVCLSEFEADSSVEDRLLIPRTGI